MRISEKGKRKEKRGLGVGTDYKPYIKAREFNSLGTCSNYVDWKNQRQYEFLSQTELQVFITYRWDDNVVDIREQFPLDNILVEKILREKNSELRKKGQKLIKSPVVNGNPMTTDLLVFYKDRHKEAISVKYDKNTLTNRDIEKLWIEKMYWKNQGVDWNLVDAAMINKVLVHNVMLVTEFYDKSRVFDKISLIKHLIATKQLIVNLEDEILDFSQLLNELENKGCKYE